MTKTSDVEMFPISSLNALEYCPRKFYYQFVQGEMLVNEYVLEGALAHQRVHQSGTSTTAEKGIQTTQLYLYSEALHISGFADVVQERSGVLIPVEYKHGQQNDWLNDHIQLCAQALCLEERQPGKPLIASGYIYSMSSRRKVQVKFTPELRARTRATIDQALRIATFDKPPAPLEGKLVARCPNCTMLPLCMPEEVRLLQSKKRK